MTEEHEEFNFSKYDQEGDSVPLPLDENMLRRRIVWDVTPCSIAEDVIKAMGLPPASEEVEETEHQEGHARMNELLPVIPVILQLSYFATEAVRESIVHALSPLGVSPEAVMDVDALHPVVLAVTMAVIAEMVDVNAIHVIPPIEITEFPQDV